MKAVRCRVPAGMTSHWCTRPRHGWRAARKAKAMLSWRGYGRTWSPLRPAIARPRCSISTISCGAMAARPACGSHLRRNWRGFRPMIARASPHRRLMGPDLTSARQGLPCNRHTESCTANAATMPSVVHHPSTFRLHRPPATSRTETNALKAGPAQCLPFFESHDQHGPVCSPGNSYGPACPGGKAVRRHGRTAAASPS